MAPLCNGIRHSCDTADHEALGMSFFFLVEYIFYYLNFVSHFDFIRSGKDKEILAFPESSRSPHCSPFWHHFCENIQSIFHILGKKRILDQVCYSFSLFNWTMQSLNVSCNWLVELLESVSVYILSTRSLLCIWTENLASEH